MKKFHKKMKGTQIKVPDSISENYEALKQRLTEILEDPENTEIHADFQTLLKMVKDAPIDPPLELDREDLIGCIAQVILLKPINAAFFPNHPFFNEQSWSRLLARHYIEKNKE